MNWEWAFLLAALLGKPRIDQRTEVRDPLFPPKRGSKNTSACDLPSGGKCNGKASELSGRPF